MTSRSTEMQTRLELSHTRLGNGVGSAPVLFPPLPPPPPPPQAASSTIGTHINNPTTRRAICSPPALTMSALACALIVASSTTAAAAAGRAVVGVAEASQQPGLDREPFAAFVAAEERDVGLEADRRDVAGDDDQVALLVLAQHRTLLAGGNEQLLGDEVVEQHLHRRFDVIAGAGNAA